MSEVNCEVLIPHEVMSVMLTAAGQASGATLMTVTSYGCMLVTSPFALFWLTPGFNDCGEKVSVNWKVVSRLWVSKQGPVKLRRTDRGVEMFVGGLTAANGYDDKIPAWWTALPSSGSEVVRNVQVPMAGFPQPVVEYRRGSDGVMWALHQDEGGQLWCGWYPPGLAE